ncbi:hypothetical protein SNE40_002490 [Patella caerulea]|uniref:Uncharacterized protein n=1 Tax=Patella caerulea TaxID=87958 RepID=A0AAN8KBX8_PATCE
MLLNVHTNQLFLLLILFAKCLAGTDWDTDRLFKDKVYPLNPRIRPLKDQSETLVVYFKLNIMAIIDFDETLQKLSTISWLELKWRDELIAWNASDYGGVMHISPDSDDIWRPRPEATHSIDESNPIGQGFIEIHVNNYGDATWYAKVNLQTFCEIDTSKYPFDTQTCRLDFMNWGSVNGGVALKTYKGGISESDFCNNGEWQLVSSSARDYDEENSNGEILENHIEIAITIKRRPSIIVLTVLLPVILLSFTKICAFIIPASSGEKLSFSITILLSMAIYMSSINSVMPETTDEISYLAIYITSELVLNSLVVLMSSISLAIYHRDTSENDTSSPLNRLLRCLECKVTAESMYNIKHTSTSRLISQKFDTICLWIVFGITTSVMVIFVFAIFIWD